MYKEQLRLNQAATSALMARLEAQRAACDCSENELHRKFNERGEIERRIRRQSREAQARKRSRVDHALLDERSEDCIKGRTPLKKKELRVFLEEEQRASEVGKLALADNAELKNLKFREGRCCKKKISRSDEKLLNRELGHLSISEIVEPSKPAPVQSHSNDEEDEEQRNEAGRGNVERWLQIMLENATAEGSSSPEKDQMTTGNAETTTAATAERMEIKYLRLKPLEQSRMSFSRSTSRRSWSAPSSPSIIIRTVDCTGEKPQVKGDEGLDSVASIRSSKKFIESCRRVGNKK